MDTKNAGMYSSIKRVSERKAGLLTQCITLKSAKKANPQLCGMVLMKINAKLGGVAVKIHWQGLKDSRTGFSKWKLCFFKFFNKLSYKNHISETPVSLFQKSPIMVTGLDLNLPVMNIGGNSRPPISALSASFDQDAMCYAMFPSLSVDPTYARLKLFFWISHKFIYLEFYQT